MNNALTLYRLQQIDSRLDQIQTRLQAIQNALLENAEIKAAREQSQKIQSELQSVEHKLKQAEHEVQAQRIKLEQAESSLYSGNIKNPKELKDLEKDVASLKKRLQELEDAQLELMLQIESNREQLQSAQTNYNAVYGKFISQNATLQTEQETLQKEKETVLAKRTAAVSSVDSSSLNLYESLRQKRSGIAVSTVSDNECDVCGASMTPGHAQSVRTSSQLVYCPMCGRILYSH